MALNPKPTEQILTQVPRVSSLQVTEKLSPKPLNPTILNPTPLNPITVRVSSLQVTEKNRATRVFALQHFQDVAAELRHFLAVRSALWV